MTFLIYYENKPIGVIDLTPCDEGVEVAILIIDAFQGKGLGTAVVFDFANRIRKMGFKYALAYVLPDNYRALAIARKIGAEVKCRDLCMIRYKLSETQEGSIGKCG